ncbi:MAG: DUF3047 domain-containing protein [Nitrospirae bacterium]|nr:DUF3047 domain-containing protein [Nitrospirota bacterium]
MKKRDFAVISWFIAAGSLLLILLSCINLYAQDDGVFLREDFNDLHNWRPLFFPKIKKHTEYTIEKDGDRSYLRAESNASASGLILKKEFNVSAYPRIKWLWKISNVYIKGNAEEKSGDDYPIRVYVIFKYDPDKASLGQRIRYGLAKAIYGEYPPHSSLTYIWESRKHDRRIITNPFAEESKMLILEAGGDNVGKWRPEEVNIVEDYKEVFGTLPPSTASLAIMNDSDNTGEKSVSYIDFIEVFK